VVYLPRKLSHRSTPCRHGYAIRIRRQPVYRKHPKHPFWSTATTAAGSSQYFTRLNRTPNTVKWPVIVAFRAHLFIL